MASSVCMPSYSFSGGEWQGHVLVQLWDEWTPVKGPRFFLVMVFCLDVTVSD